MQTLFAWHTVFVSRDAAQAVVAANKRDEPGLDLRLVALTGGAGFAIAVHDEEDGLFIGYL